MKPGAFIVNKNKANGPIYAIVLSDRRGFDGWVTVRCHNGVKTSGPVKPVRC